MARRSPLPAALRSAEAKLARANLHTQATKRVTRRFLDGQPEPVRVDARFEGEQTIGSEGRVFIYVAKGYPALPSSYSARFGDAIHNYRCVLDHIAWALVAHGNEPAPKESWLVQYPIYNSGPTFDTNRPRRLPGVASLPVEFIKARQAQAGWDNPENPLLLLAGFSNDDKHRALKVFVAGVSRVAVEYDPQDCDVISHLAPVFRPSLQNGAVIAALDVRFTGPNPKMKMDIDVTPGVAVEDSGEIGTMLTAIRTEVTTILYAPEITGAVA